MARTRTYKTEAVVLKQTPLGEADRILALYTPDLGKVRAVAKGVRRTKSRLGGHLELLNQVSVSIAQGRNLDVINEAQVVQTFQGLRGDLRPLSRALFVAELVEGFATEWSPNTPLYRLLVDVLGWLDSTERPDLLVPFFEMHLVDCCGYRPELYSCVECRTRLEPGDYLFDCSAGGVVCNSCRATSGQPLIPLSLNGMKVLRFLQREQAYSRVEGLGVPPRLLSEIERLLRTYNRFLLERELKSAEFLDRVSVAPA